MENHWRKTIQAGGLLACVLATVGCSYVQVAEDPRFDRENFEQSLPRSLALAPTVNLTEIEGAEDLFRDRLYGALSTLPYDDVELSRVDATILAKAQILNMPPEEVDRYYIAEPDLADAVVFTEIQRIRRTNLLFYARVSVDVSVAMFDTRTKRKLYQNIYSIRHNLLAIPGGPLGLITSIVQTFRHTQTKHLDETMILTGDVIAKRFPSPASLAVAGGTVINKVAVTVPRAVMREGDRVLLKVTGTPNRATSLSIGLLAADLELVEASSGVYAGFYVVKKGDVGRFLFATIRMVNPLLPDSEVAVLEANDQPFAIDTIAPLPYEVDSWLQHPDRPGLTLRFSPENRGKSEEIPVGYHIYRGEGVGNSLMLIGSVDDPSFEDETAVAGIEYEYAVVAEDAAGNRSEPRSRVLVRP